MISLYNRLRQEVVQLICDLKHMEPAALTSKPDLLQLGFNLADVVDVMQAVEKKYDIVIAGDLPVYTVDDFVRIVQQFSRRFAL
ncbi:acyl carrier protein [Pontibacter sp. H259]|uniref:acyl carrier protein n=1 Tax=Pontibacter sp. H259 TaxID=3133421 RepID=UPI0030BDEF35